VPSDTVTERDYLHDRVLGLRDTPMQRKLRRIRPWPVGCVFIEHPGMSDEDIRGHFRLMRELGFTALKQCQTCRGTDRARVMHMALDEGIIPWWYGEAGWEEPTPTLLDSLGIDPDLPIDKLRENQAWLARQEQVMRDRIDGKTVALPVQLDPTLKQLMDAPAPEVPGVQLSFEYALTEAHQPLFIDWLKRTYGDIDALNEAWNVHHCMIPGARDQRGGERPAGFWQSWEHLASELLVVINGERREYRRIRDVFRFKADVYLDFVRAKTDADRRSDPNVPTRAGGEMGLFLPFASRGTDMEGIAEVMAERGSFYPSVHLAWHFEETDFEYVRPMYMQSAIAADWFKGGWSATWESTGGPQQMTGHKAPFVPKVRHKTPGFTVDGGVMRQLMLSWIAGGFRGFGLWCWSVRSAGWEGGEFGLIDRNNHPTDRAVEAGRIGRACRELRDELWRAVKEPDVGIFQDWDAEAIWAASSLGGRDHFKSEPIRARIGAARAMIDANVPWEHVTARQLQAGLADRYRAIVLPAVLGLDADLLPVLADYVERGGRLVLDAPGAWFDTYGRLLSTDDGSPFERLFGVRIADYQWSRPGGYEWAIDGRVVDGCTFDLQPTTASVAQWFDDRQGQRPAVTINAHGQGCAIVLGYPATLSCCSPSNREAESDLRRWTLGETYQPGYACEVLTYRLAAPRADHYFLINEGAAQHVSLQTPGYGYARFEDVLDERKAMDPSAIELSPHSGRWIRAVKLPPGDHG